MWSYGTKQASGQELTLVTHEVGLLREHKQHTDVGLTVCPRNGSSAARGQTSPRYRPSLTIS